MTLIYIIGILLVALLIQTSRSAYWKGRFESLSSEADDNQQNLKRVINRLRPKKPRS